VQHIDGTKGKYITSDVGLLVAFFAFHGTPPRSNGNPFDTETFETRATSTSSVVAVQHFALFLVPAAFSALIRTCITGINLGHAQGQCRVGRDKVIPCPCGIDVMGTVLWVNAGTPGTDDPLVAVRRSLSVIAALQTSSIALLPATHLDG
jgi:hypothetical protein